jgi:ribulose-phosphate 3-epimerase
MIIAPSVLAADFTNLESELQKTSTTKWLHLDVMDGHFVPNISFGPMIVNAIRTISSQQLDTHLMISEPSNYIDQFIEAGSDRITFHIETVSNPLELIEYIKSKNIKVGLSIKPNTKVDSIKEYLSEIDQVLVMSVEPGFGGQRFIPESLDKIKELNEIRKNDNLSFLIVVDGGVNDKNSKELKAAGVDVLVAGSFVFKADNPLQRIESLK